MMIYKKSKETLIKEGVIKECPIDYRATINLIKRAYTDLRTAKRNLADDEECAYNYAYNAMLRSGMALMASEGFRPEIKDKHLTIVKFVSSILGEKFKNLINNQHCPVRFLQKKNRDCEIWVTDGYTCSEKCWFHF